MKNTLLLSLVASTMIMAGGDIVPVSIPVPTPVASGWTFDGNMVAYYQTADVGGAVGDVFSKETTFTDFGVQLRAVNKDLIWGLGAGFEITGLGTLSSFDNSVQTAGGNNNIGGALTQAYLTYGLESISTHVKLGRQTLPKSLSPFAFSEGWQPVKNTFDAALLVNKSITDTTIVYAFVDKANPVTGANVTGNNISMFNQINGDDGAHMLTIQNKSIDGLTLTGSYYHVADAATTNATGIAWLDAKFKISDYTVALQGGSVMDEDLATNTTAFGAKIAAKYDSFHTMLAFSSVHGDADIKNVAGIKTPLYTQMVFNQNAIRKNSDTVVAKIGTHALGGSFGLAVNYSMNGQNSGETGFNGGPIPKIDKGTYLEVDLTYKTKITENTTLFAAYVYGQETPDTVTATNLEDTTQFVRVWARYNFN